MAISMLSSCLLRQTKRYDRHITSDGLQALQAFFKTLQEKIGATTPTVTVCHGEIFLSRGGRNFDACTFPPLMDPCWVSGEALDLWLGGMGRGSIRGPVCKGRAPGSCRRSCGVKLDGLAKAGQTDIVRYMTCRQNWLRKIYGMKKFFGEWIDILIFFRKMIV
jgi:hypothetical protein